MLLVSSPSLWSYSLTRDHRMGIVHAVVTNGKARLPAAHVAETWRFLETAFLL